MSNIILFFFQTFVDQLLLNWLNMLFMCKAIKQKEKKRNTDVL